MKQNQQITATTKRMDQHSLKTKEKCHGRSHMKIVPTTDMSLSRAS